MERYRSVVRRYLLGALKDADAADELTQEFALRFLRGDLKGADRDRGRFRDYLRGALSHLIGDYYRRQKKNPLPLAVEHELAAKSEDVISPSDEQFIESWRADLIDRAWQALARLQEESGKPFYAVLQYRASHLDMHSDEMAEQLSRQLDRPVTAAWVRQTLHRARERFADYLLASVRDTLEQPTLEQLEDELVLLGLHEYCQPALERLRADRST
jgi:RNA polymerase sigma-70 factor (ECF subfamily)